MRAAVCSWDNSYMKSSLQKVVTDRLAEIGIGHIQAAQSAGMEKTFIRDIVEGRKESVRQSSIAKLAAALRWSPAQLNAAIEGREVVYTPELLPVTSPLVPIRLQGVVEAGAWREFEDFDQSEPTFLYDVRDQEFPDARMMAWDVAGTSMNALKPRAIQDGDRLIAVDFDDTGLAVAHGMVVIVQQAQQGGHLREVSVKQVALFDDRVEFQPRSLDPKHKPIVVDRDLHADDGRSVEIIGLVRRVTNDIPLGF